MKSRSAAGCSDDMTMNEMLHDSLVRQVLRADGVSLATFAIILETAARDFIASRELRLRSCPASDRTGVHDFHLSGLEVDHDEQAAIIPIAPAR